MGTEIRRAFWALRFFYLHIVNAGMLIGRRVTDKLKK